MNSGIVTPRPEIAYAPTPSIEPINALSAVLYKQVTSIAIIAGIEYLTNNLLVLSFAKLSILSPI